MSRSLAREVVMVNSSGPAQLYHPSRQTGRRIEKKGIRDGRLGSGHPWNTEGK